MRETYPNCSVVVLNYFGERVIKNTINSLLNLDYPKEKLEILIVDNNSQDKSREIIMNYAEQEKNIKYIFLNKNKGFAGGNNEGIKVAKGEYVTLLNNDCIVEKDWLTELVKTARKDPKIFAVSSKIKLYPKYYNLKFNYTSGLFLVNAFLKDGYLAKLEKPRNVNLEVILEDGYSVLEIPYVAKDGLFSVEMVFELDKQDSIKSYEQLVTILNDEGVEGHPKITVHKQRLVFTVKFDAEKFDKNSVFDKIQNAGIVVFQNGAGRDIGAQIIVQRQFYECDYGQYAEEQEVYAACGAAVMYNKKILGKIGFLEDLFFMYYEDVEISERARLRGYKIFYCPNAEVRHLHAFSSKEWSNFFIYQAEKGRLLHIFFSFPLRVFIKEFFILIIKIAEVGVRIMKNLSDRKRVIKFIRGVVGYVFREAEKEGAGKTDFGKVMQYIKIILYFSGNMPMLILKRYIKHRHISSNAIINNYQDILKGKWYFN
ncbi:MAG: glycosyltransferase family 2 protein [Microgenomates group bacterium]|jgi:GT2 family glycosyltransferase